MARKFVRSFSSLVVFAAFSSFTLTASAQLHSRIVQNVGDTEAVAISAPHPLARLEFDRVRVPISAMIGAPGQGFKIAMATLDIFRATVGAAALGLARRAFDEAIMRVRKRAPYSNL